MKISLTSGAIWSSCCGASDH